MSQLNLGIALRALGERESGMAKLEEAVAAYREALKELTRERMPLQWATTEHNLGLALRDIGERGDGIVRLEEAAGAFRDAIKERTLEVAPRDWVLSNLRLGNCLTLIAHRSRDPARAGEAIEALARARDVIAPLSDEALRLEVEESLSAAYFSRGRLLLYNGSLAEARADFKHLTELEPKNTYAALWLDIAERRNKLPSRLSRIVSGVDMKAWPAPVIRLFLGEITLATVLAAADDPDPTKKREQVCEANFYSGELALLKGAKDQATRLFRLAASDCPKSFVEWEGANAELKALGAR